MQKLLVSLKKFLLDLFFPKFCFNCKKEGSYLCEDCQSTLDVLKAHQEGQSMSDDPKDLYFAVNYHNPLIENLIRNFKEKPFLKELAKPLSSLILEHFQLLDNKPDFTGFTLVPVPLDKKKLKRRGFNQAEEIAKELSFFLGIPLLTDCLVKTKSTLPHNRFSIQTKEENEIAGKKILLVDDFLITGSTLKECAKVLKEAGATETIGVVVVRG
jgi:competence protein ComFC